MIQMLFHLFSKKEGKKPERQDQQKRPLNWFLFFWLGFIYVQYMLPNLVTLLQGMENNPSPVPFAEGLFLQVENGSPPLFALVVFTLLMALHSDLHWMALFKALNSRYLWLYFSLQVGCIWLIYCTADGGSGSDSVLLELCLMLALEVMILFQRIARIAVGAAACLLFYLAIQGGGLLVLMQQHLPVEPKVIGVLTESSALIPFVCASVVLYIQQTRAHQRDQKLLRELETAHIQLEDYAARVQDLTLTTERQRMARELHDTLAQGLVGLTMQLETIDSLLNRQRCEQARTIVQQAMTRSRAAITSARAAIADLRTESAATGDLLAAIEAEAQHFTLATGIPCSCCLQTKLPGEYHEHLLRLTREGLTNIARHAQASQVWIRAGIENAMITLDIEDNGIGFDPAQVATGHYGLLGLRERARLMNSHLLIDSEPGRGTTVRLCLPVERMCAYE
jgi:NarL family two-component system sensor histidine kinase YdfH